MQSITKRRRCIICDVWMEVGTKFVFVERRFRGQSSYYIPAHAACATPTGARQQLDEAMARAAREGHISAYDRGDLYEI